MNTWLFGIIGWACFLGWLIAEAEEPTKKGSRLGLLLLALYTVLFLIFGIWVYITALCLIILAVLAFVILFIIAAFCRVIFAAIGGKTHEESR